MCGSEALLVGQKGVVLLRAEIFAEGGDGSPDGGAALGVAKLRAGKAGSKESAVEVEAPTLQDTSRTSGVDIDTGANVGVAGEAKISLTSGFAHDAMISRCVVSSRG